MEASVRLVRRCLRGSAGLTSGLISSFGRLGTSRNGGLPPQHRQARSPRLERSEGVAGWPSNPITGNCFCRHLSPPRLRGLTRARGARRYPTFRYAPLSSGLDLVRKCLGQHEIATPAQRYRRHRN
jgi:hypothetical protein